MPHTRRILRRSAHVGDRAAERATAASAGQDRDGEHREEGRFAQTRTSADPVASVGGLRTIIAVATSAEEARVATGLTRERAARLADLAERLQSA
jgi:hypothetical protein